jgi:hypothetical protein
MNGGLRPVREDIILDEVGCVVQLIGSGHGVVVSEAGRGSVVDQVACYSHEDRALIEVNARDSRWEDACIALESLSEDSWKNWWELGKQITRDMFSDLAELIYGEDAGMARHAYHLQLLLEAELAVFSNKTQVNLFPLIIFHEKY